MQCCTSRFRQEMRFSRLEELDSFWGAQITGAGGPEESHVLWWARNEIFTETRRKHFRVPLSEGLEDAFLYATSSPDATDLRLPVALDQGAYTPRPQRFLLQLLHFHLHRSLLPSPTSLATAATLGSPTQQALSIMPSSVLGKRTRSSNPGATNTFPGLAVKIAG